MPGHVVSIALVLLSAQACNGARYQFPVPPLAFEDALRRTHLRQM